MAGRTPHAAVTAFLEPLQLAVSCVTRTQLTISGRKPSDHPHVLTLGQGQSVPLGREGEVFLYATQHYAIVKDHRLGPWKVRTRQYWYHLLTPSGEEVLLFHFHPEDRSRFPRPHLHIGPAVRYADVLDKAHVPTGRIALEEVLLLAIQDLGVDALRADAVHQIEEALRLFKTYRTWS